MTVTRRETLVLGMGAAVAALVPVPGQGHDGKAFVLTAPSRVAPGETFDLSVLAEGAASVTVLAPGLTHPRLGTVTFGPRAQDQTVTARLTLDRTTRITALGTMADGSRRQASQVVVVSAG